MELTITNSLIILLGIVITWLVLFSLLTEKNTNMVGIKLGILVLLFSPFIASASYSLYATWSRQWFMMSGVNGEIQLAASPLKDPRPGSW
ncbi:hypothetical protein Lbir_1922 [Legionella birminghamensis]|uniref:Uncharacterized protein n=1 Tax=Legionella birminghamensis TaxID=28083 RepID=A0A378JRA0_9GAMM|nr:hypothetical protein Lbir_1922 [Legionella birminghamensis]STX60886.1 Uncharacterised protein [Legionella birminghamensis]